MKQILIVSLLLVGCGVARPSQTETVTVLHHNVLPVGTSVQYRVITSDQQPIYALVYWDEQSNRVSLRRVPSGWTNFFNTVREHQAVILTCLISHKDTSTVTGQIWVNGVLGKQASGQSISLAFPR